MREGSPISCGSGSDSGMDSTSDIVYRTFDLSPMFRPWFPYL